MDVSHKILFEGSPNGCNDEIIIVKYG